ncbi:MAG: ATP-binding cassette domain-containing protein [bacterium]|nr:ATP-binding cassette domain-containing protein [bacterium]
MLKENIDNNLLEVRNLKKYFPVQTSFFSSSRELVHAVDGVSFGIKPGETLGLAGESGCGKSTLARLILRLVEPDSGEIIFAGEDFLKKRGQELRRLRRKIQIVFQDPQSSLNPRMKAGEIISEPIQIHSLAPSRAARKEIVIELLRQVGLPPDSYSRYPHEFSGGQRQRIGIARALALNPELIVADEPVSSLDVSIQAQILNLFSDLKTRKNLTYLFISHDLRVLSWISDRIAVMYLGEMTEIAPTQELINKPLHPYTQALFAAVPIPDPATQRKKLLVPGEPPSPIHPPSGCRFHPRCPFVFAPCKDTPPPLKPAGNDRLVSCHLY